MRPVLLIAVNYLREQRWAVILLIVSVMASSLLVYFGRMEREDALFFFKQQAFYGLVVSAFLAGAALQNERRSRRILAVLSKGIGRAQYLAGLITGLLLVLAVYGAAIGVFGMFLANAFHVPWKDLWSLLLLLMVACMFVAAVTILFSTFTPPLVATALTVFTLGTGFVLDQVFGMGSVFPVARVFSVIASYPAQWGTEWQTAIWTFVQSLLLWLLASWIFERRDIAVAVE